VQAQNRGMRATWIAIAAALLVAGAGCGGGSGSKSGAHLTPKLSLRFEVPDDGDPPAARFADAVLQRSHGALEVRHDVDSPYTSVLPANELRLAHALEAGKVQVGYLPARAWALAGVDDFKALLTPFVLTTQRASIALVSSPLATSILQSLPRSVVGLALVPQETRRVLAVRPPTSLDALRGLRIRIVDNPQTAADVRAVRATPVQHVSSQEANRLLVAGKLDGVESNPGSILGNAYQAKARYLSTWSPFAKFQTIVVSRKTWNRLSVDQRSALRAAARDAVAAAIKALPATERRDLLNLCAAGVQPAQPSPDALAEISGAMSSATPLLTDPAADELLARLLALPGSGLQPLATPLPKRCLEPAPPQQQATGGPTIPRGVYTVTIPAEEWLKGNVINPDFKTAITFVTTLHKDGTWYQTQTPNYPDQGPFRGTYTVHGDEATFVMTSAGVHGQNSIAAPETVKWRFFDGKLTLKNVVVADNASRVIYATHPWRKIR
jgi:TRAP-type C4-dicarboxylate transport system substrate-binding protein